MRKFVTRFVALLAIFTLPFACAESEPLEVPTPDVEPEVVAPTLMVSKNEIYVDGAGGQASLVIASSDSWVATCSDANVTFDPASGGASDNDLTITVAASIVEQSVEFTVVIKASNSAGSIEKEVTIIQSAGVAPPSYGIYNVNDLVEFAAAVNSGASLEDWQDEDGVIRQKADIDMDNYYGWEPIGFYSIYEDHSFAGVFDGNGYKFTNFDITQTSSYSGIAFALFGASVGTIRNVVIESGSVVGRGSSNYVAAICGKNYGVIENCDNGADVSLTEDSDGTYVAGIVGIGYGELTNLVNRGSISGGGYVGGICGLNSADLLEYCVNYGTISSIKRSAGIASYNSSTVEFCENYGDVLCTESEYAAGIVGYNNFSCYVKSCVNNGHVYGVGYANCGIVATNWGTVEDCVNNGDIEGNLTFAAGLVAANSGYILGSGNINNGTISGEAMFMGGIAGYNFSSSSIIGAINNGEVYAEYMGTDGMYTAGIVPYASASSESIISDCVNNGDVTCISSTEYYAGGIIALTDVGLSNCTNTGNVTGGIYTGGIAGQSTTANLLFDGCVNSGSVTNSEVYGYVGGILGYGHYYTNITSCENSGNVISEKGPCAGGIISKSLYLTISGCTNSGDVECEYGAVGGIVGDLITKSALSDCVNRGAITGGTALGEAGGIAGYMDYTSTAEDYLNEGSVNGVTPGADFGRTN